MNRVETLLESIKPASHRAELFEAFERELFGGKFCEFLWRFFLQTQSIGSESYLQEYTYNLAGQLVSEKYPSRKIVKMTVDNFGRLATVGDAQKTYLTGVTFNSQGLLSQLNLGNFTSETFTYNDRFQMTSQSLSRGAEVLQKYDYSYGTTDLTTGSIDATKNNGQLGKIEGWIGANKQWSQRFGYDELGRLSEAREYKAGDNAQLSYKQKFDFDRFGNLYRKAANNPTAGQQNPLPFTTIEDADINKATNRFATGTTYDEAGQVVNDAKFRSIGFAYDANGRQVKATKTGVPDAWTVYDALGNRVATKINDVWQYMIYDAFGKLIAEYGLLSEPPASAGGFPSGVKYIQQDWQGSVRTVTNKGAFVVSRTDHQAFGEEIGAGIGLRTAQQGYGISSSARQGYGLTEKDDTGLNHTWFRKNENKAGRWTSPDPYKGSMSLANPQSFNRYSYVGNQPTNFVDPSGLIDEEPGVITVHTWTYGNWWDALWSLFLGGLDRYVHLPVEAPAGTEPPLAGGLPIAPPPSTCTLTVYVSAVSLSGSSGSSSGQNNRENPPEGRVGIINHLYLTYQDSSNGLTIGVRAGPVSVNKNESDYLLGSFGLYQKGGFSDFEKNPVAAVTENYDENCDKFDKSFKETIANLDKAKIRYSSTGNNSNAFLYTLLNRAGINADSFTPRINAALGYFGTAVGWGTEVPIP